MKSLRMGLLASMAMAGMLGGGLAHMPLEFGQTTRVENQGRTERAPTPIAYTDQRETAKERFDRLRGTTPRRGGSSGGHRSAGDRAHTRMKSRRAASHHGA